MLPSKFEDKLFEFILRGITLELFPSKFLNPLPSDSGNERIFELLKFLDLDGPFFFSVLRPLLMGVMNSKYRLNLLKLPKFINPQSISISDLLDSDENDDSSEPDFKEITDAFSVETKFYRYIYIYYTTKAFIFPFF